MSQDDKFTPENEEWIVDFSTGFVKIKTKNGIFVAEGWSPRIELAARAPDLLRENRELKRQIDLQIKMSKISKKALKADNKWLAEALKLPCEDCGVLERENRELKKQVELQAKWIQEDKSAIASWQQRSNNQAEEIQKLKKEMETVKTNLKYIVGPEE